MNKKLSEIFKAVEVMDAATTIASGANSSTDFFVAPGKHERKICFVVTAEYEGEGIADTLLEGETVTLRLREATSSAGAGERAIEDRDGNDIVTTITGAQNAVEVIVLHTAAYIDGDNITVNGVQFSRDAAGYDADLRPLNYNSRADLVNAINNEFDDIEARNATDADALFIRSTNPGEVGVTVEEDIDAGGAFAASFRIIGYIDVDASQLDIANDFEFAGVNVLNSSVAGDADFSCLAIMGDARYNPAPGPGR